MSKDKKKFTEKELKAIPKSELNKLLTSLKEHLKKEKIMQEAFNKYRIDIEEIDYIPMMFGDLEVSAKTDHGVIIFNYKLLEDGDFLGDFSYGIHEITHWLQQCSGNKGTQSASDGDYLDNPDEKEGFQYQIKYIDKHYGEEKAENYVNNLINYHDVDDKKEKKEELMAKI